MESSSTAMRNINKRLCICSPTQEEAYKEPIIGCSNAWCRPRWYHERCVGMQSATYLYNIWFCPQCSPRTAPPLRVCVCDTPPYYSGPMRECAKGVQCRIRWFHRSCTPEMEVKKEWVCEECILNDTVKDKGGDGNETSVVVVEPVIDEDAAEEMEWVSDGVPGVFLHDESVAQSPKGKGNDETSPARETMTSRQEVTEVSGPPEPTHNPSPSPLEPRVEMCTCGTPGNNWMVACDGVGCAREWFHFECVGMTAATVPEGEWYCEECVEKRGSMEEKMME